jgi:hypothetical protein
MQVGWGCEGGIESCSGTVRIPLTACVTDNGVLGAHWSCGCGVYFLGAVDAMKSEVGGRLGACLERSPRATSIILLSKSCKNALGLVLNLLEIWLVSRSLLCTSYRYVEM